MALAVLFSGGLVGGSLTDWLRGEPAFAQDDVLGVLRAKGLAIVDDAGNDRATIAVTDDGSVGLVLMDDAGTQRMIINQQATGDAGIQIFDEAGDWRCGFASGPASTGANFTSQNDTVALGINVAGDGQSGGMYLTNAQGTQVLGLGTSPGGTGIDLMDLTGATRTNVGVGDDGNASIRVLDANGVTRTAMGVDGNGVAGIGLIGEDSEEIWRVE